MSSPTPRVVTGTTLLNAMTWFYLRKKFNKLEVCLSFSHHWLGCFFLLCRLRLYFCSTFLTAGINYVYAHCENKLFRSPKKLDASRNELPIRFAQESNLAFLPTNPSSSATRDPKAQQGFPIVNGLKKKLLAHKRLSDNTNYNNKKNSFRAS